MSSTSAIDVISDPPGTATNVSAFSFASLLARVKVWFEPCSQLFILVQQAVSNVYRECDPLVLGLTLAALAIALFGMVAIYCQCRLWKRAKQQRLVLMTLDYPSVGCESCLPISLCAS